MKAIRNNLGFILLSIAELAIGILLIISPVGFTTAVLCTVGVTIAVMGAYSVLRYFRIDAEKSAMGLDLFVGLTAMTVGIICVANTTALAMAEPFLAVFLGIALTLLGILKIQWCVDMLRLKRDKWYIPAAGAVISIVCGVLIITNPFGSADGLWLFTAISLIIDAVCEIVILIFRRRTPADKQTIEDELDEDEE